MSYDPAFANTAACRSRITFIDGDKGILRYRGYPIEELAEKSNYLEIAYLIVKGELPDREHYARWENNIKIHTMVHENIKKFMEGYRYDAHPMGMLVGTVGALSTFYPDAKNIHDLESRRLQTRRLIGKIPTLAAFAYRHTRGLAVRVSGQRAQLHGQFALDALQDDRAAVQTQSGARARTRRAVHSARRPRAELFGQRDARGRQLAARSLRRRGRGRRRSVRSAPRRRQRGGDSRMLMEIGSVKNIPAFIKAVKNEERRLMGFGHRVYKNYDPRAKILKEMAEQVFEVTGRNPLIDIAVELERIALQDDYFITHKLYPNVDFYSGIIYQAMGFQMEMFPVLFAIPRTSGWMAQWAEMVRDPEQAIARPRQIYIGENTRHYAPLESRPKPTMREDAVSEAI